MAKTAPLRAPSRRRFQYSLRMLLTATLMAACFFSGIRFEHERRRIQDEREMEAHAIRAPGPGLRIHIPAMGPAPIALDFAVPVHKAPGDRLQDFNFFMGFNR